jgi:hypothetical protein
MSASLEFSNEYRGAGYRRGDLREINYGAVGYGVGGNGVSAKEGSNTEGQADVATFPMVFPMLDGRLAGAKGVGEASGEGRIGWEPPFSWSTIVPSARRQESIEGVLLGCAVGEGLGGLSKRWRRDVVRYRGGLRSGYRADGMIVTIQSLLLSQAATENFCRNLSRRMGWYRWSMPVRTSMSRWFTRGGFAGNDPLVRAMVLSVVMQGHHEGILRWVHKSTRLTHREGLNTQGAFLVATAAQCAQFHGTKYSVEPAKLLARLAEATQSRELSERLNALQVRLDRGDELREVVVSLGVKGGWRDHLIGNALLGVYVYAKHSEGMLEGMQELLRLPGNLSGVAAIYGGLVAVHGGCKGIPRGWLEGLSMYPYSDGWVQGYVDRCLDWPHGPEDIQDTAALPSYPIGQFFRNLARVVS